MFRNWLKLNSLWARLAMTPLLSLDPVEKRPAGLGVFGQE
jgi:hypothetical protein